MKKTAPILCLGIVLLVLTVAAGCEKVGAEPAASQPSPARPAVGRQDLPGGMTIQVSGLRVVAPGPAQESMEMRAFNWSPGTTVAVCIQRPTGGIMGIDGETSKIVAFRDNQGTDLWNGAKAGEFSHSSLDMMPQVAEDGTAILFEVDAQGIPRPGATTFTLQGTVALAVAADKTSLTAKDVSLESGSQFKAGSRTIEVTETGAPAWGDENAFAATLELKGEVDDIVEITFLDASGTTLPADRQSSIWSGSGENRIHQWEYVFESRPSGPVQVVVTQWTDLTKESVPFDLTFGAGL